MSRPARSGGARTTGGPSGPSGRCPRDPKGAANPNQSLPGRLSVLFSLRYLLPEKLSAPGKLSEGYVKLSRGPVSPKLSPPKLSGNTFSEGGGV